MAERTYPPRSIAPSGATIPGALREPEVSEQTRDQLRDRINRLPSKARQQLEMITADLCIPNLLTGRFTRAHGALLGRLIDEVTR